MAARNEILGFCDELLDVASFPDHTPVGLQVAGVDEITKLVCSVSPSRELFERAAEAGAQLVLCHHGLFWERDDRVIGPVMRDRLRTLFDANLNFAAYHLALDAHPEIGNNAFLCRELGIDAERVFSEVGWGGTLREPVAMSAFAEQINKLVDRAPLVFAYGPEEIRTVAVCSGGAARAIDEAIAEGYDCFVTGEAAEPTKHLAKEAGIHFVAAGHYATETSGVKFLADRIKERFGVEWEFVDLPNPV